MLGKNVVPVSLKNFLFQEDGVVSIEAAVMLPLMGVATIAGFSYYDTYRREAQLTRATFVVADIIARADDSEVIGPLDFEGLQDLFEFITNSEGQSRLRFTQVRRVGDDIVISESVAGVPDTYATDGTPPMTPEQIQAYRGQIPRIEDGDYLVLVESFTMHDPVFAVGLVEREFPRFVPTPARYETSINFDMTRLPAPEGPPQPFNPGSVSEPTLPPFDSIATLFAPESDLMNPLELADDILLQTEEPIETSSVMPENITDTAASDDGNDDDDDDDNDDSSVEVAERCNNGWGNGDQCTPGNSGNNQAENSNNTHRNHGRGNPN
jgi:hypothetical protein